MISSGTSLPRPATRPTVTDGGMETDLIFHHGVDLPELAALPLLEDEDGWLLSPRRAPTWPPATP